MSNVRTGARRDTLALYGPTPTSGVNPGQQDSHGLGEMGTRKGDSTPKRKFIFSIIGGIRGTYLRDNMNSVQEFSDHAKAILGDDLHGRIQQGDAAFVSQQAEFHQRLLLALVPKLVSDHVRQQNWHVETTWGYAYGTPGTSKAPMVSWAMRFSQAQGKLPDELYRENVGRILAAAGELSSAGKITQFV